jgi:hypothetical protein
LSLNGTAYAPGVAYDEGLVERVRDQMGSDLSLSEQRMFGGLALMSWGNMCFAVIGDDLLVRVGPDDYAASLTLPFVKEMDLTGRTLRGIVLVDGVALGEDGPLREWMERGLAFTDSLPPK